MDYKSFEKFISCGVCFEIFDQSSKRPRMLACGHSFCHSCLKTILQWQKTHCPNCNANISFTSAESIPINFAMESMISLRLDADHQKALSTDNSYTKIKKQIDQMINIEIEIIRESLKNLNGKLNSLKQLQTVVKNSQSEPEISQAMNRIDSLLHKGKYPIDDSLSIVNLRNWCRENSAYAIAFDERDNTPMYGKLSVKEGRIWVDSFQTENPNCRLIPLKDLLSKFTKSSELPETGFLQLTRSDCGSSTFDVVIKTQGSTPRARNFILLCSALKRTTYKGMQMENRKTFYIIDPGPCPVVKGIGEHDEKKSQVQKRSVYGMWGNDSWFYIQLENEQGHSYLKFGIVMDGIQNLQTCQGILSVEQCGFVI